MMNLWDIMEMTVKRVKMLQATMVGFSRQWRKLLFLLLFVHATNLFLCGHEWVKRLSGLDALCLHVVHRVIKEWSARLNLLCMFHTVCTSSSSFYSYSTKAQKKKKKKVGGQVACKRRHTEQPATSCSIRLHTGAAKHGLTRVCLHVTVINE